MMKKGTLYLVATPIGNLEDMTYRAINTLKNVNLIAAEDTRNTRKLLTHFDIKTNITSYHEHNKSIKNESLISKLKEGLDIALVSDAGMPCINDPGVDLVKLCIEEEITVSPIPGANAALSCFIASGFSTANFFYEGFLPKTKKNRKERLIALKEITTSIILYESPHRLLEVLKDMIKIYGEDRRICLGREITKKFEEFKYGTLIEILNYFMENTPKGEFVLVLEPQLNTTELDAEEIDPITLVFEKVKEGIDKKTAIKEVAKICHISRRDLYQKILALEK